MLFAASEIHEREGKLGVAHDAQVRLNAAFHNHARLCLTLRAHGNDPGLLDEKVDHVRRFL